MYYRVCDACGANLDPGEVCDCTKEETAPAQRERPQTIRTNYTIPNFQMFVKGVFPGDQ